MIDQPLADLLRQDVAARDCATLRMLAYQLLQDATARDGAVFCGKCASEHIASSKGVEGDDLAYSYARKGASFAFKVLGRD